MTPTLRSPFSLRALVVAAICATLFACLSPCGFTHSPPTSADANAAQKQAISSTAGNSESHPRPSTDGDISRRPHRCVDCTGCQFGQSHQRSKAQCCRSLDASHLALNCKSPGEPDCSEGDVAWSPDSKQIAFVSDCATPGQQQVFVSNVDFDPSGNSREASVPWRLTSLKGYIHDLEWSPDGKRIGFLFVENATRPPGALAAMKPAIGVISASTMAEVQRIAMRRCSRCWSAIAEDHPGDPCEFACL